MTVPNIPGAFNCPRVRPGDGAESGTGRTAVRRAGSSRDALSYVGRMQNTDGQAAVAGDDSRPLIDAQILEARYEAVAEAHGDLLKREEMRRAFSGILDLERLLARLSLDSAGPRDVRALAASSARLPGLKAALGAFAAPLWRSCWRGWTHSKT